MYEYYTIAHVALITGLTDRTVRSHIKKGLLQGERINGLWHFTPEQVVQYIEHPSVASSIKARKNALIYDFLADEYKRKGAICALIDEPATLSEANSISEFFCHLINTEFTESALRFAFSFSKGSMRIILSGEKDAVQDLLSRYRERN